MRIMKKYIYFNLNSVRLFSDHHHKWNMKRCYEILEIPEGSTQDQIRNAYLLLVKKYHPDSGSEKANVEKFYEVDKAFKALCSKTSTQERVPDKGNVKEQNIKHTAPQHRQYLSYEGYGFGNPFQREKQYTKQRAIKASQNVINHRVEKATAEEHALLTKKTLRHDIKTRYGIDRLVEDLIQESMSKGEFSKLSGVGKPLKENHNRNPYVDFVTHKVNEILIDNGFAPEWITLNNEIREELTTLRNKLREERKSFKKYPLNDEDAFLWQECVATYKNHVKDLNSKIDKFNLVVPILNKQRFRVDLKQEAQKILRDGIYCTGNVVRQSNRGQIEDRNSNTGSANTDNFFGFLEKLFKWN